MWDTSISLTLEQPEKEDNSARSLDLYRTMMMISITIDPTTVIKSACLPFSLYLGNPMDPPDVLGADPNARPLNLPGRAKSE